MFDMTSPQKLEQLLETPSKPQKMSKSKFYSKNDSNEIKLEQFLATTPETSENSIVQIKKRPTKTQNIAESMF